MDKLDFSSLSFLNPAVHQGLKPEAHKTRGRGDTKKSSSFFAGLLGDFLPTPATGLGPLQHLAPSEEALTELMDAVHSAGSDLRDRPFAEEILAYKKAVRNFVNYVVENSYDVEKSQTRRRGNIKIHVQIQVIDRKLEELAAAILSGQSTQLIRVSKLDELRGLLVDLTIGGAIRERDE
ncbi:MAG: YaaR family protein [Treponema sp.]|nr:YaaR family protein [Treponema sp.]